MRKFMVLAAALAVFAGGGAYAAEIEIKMLNKGTDGALMVFEPAFVKIEAGDSVKFVATDKGHNAETIKGMLPEGASAFVSKLGDEVTVKFEQAGVYGIKCAPHYGMGMVALIVAGAPGNLDQAKAVPQVGKAKQVFATLFEKLDRTKTAEK